MKKFSSLQWDRTAAEKLRPFTPAPSPGSQRRAPAPSRCPNVLQALSQPRWVAQGHLITSSRCPTTSVGPWEGAGRGECTPRTPRRCLDFGGSSRTPARYVGVAFVCHPHALPQPPSQRAESSGCAWGLSAKRYFWPFVLKSRGMKSFNSI